MKQINFTKRAIEAIKPPAGGRLMIYDTKTPALALRVTPTGTKSFILYRKVDGKPVRLTLGRFPAMTVEQARRAATRRLAEIADGKNPVEEKRRREAESLTLRQALEEYRQIRDLAPRTVKDLDNAARFAWPDWLDKRLIDITPEMVLRRYRNLCARGSSGAAASLWMRYLRAIVACAAKRHRRPDGTPLLLYNPVQILSDTRAWKRPQRRQRYIKPHELKPWWQALERINPHHRDLFRFQVLTGLRPSEAASLQWGHIDLDGRTFTLPLTKARRPHTLPLSDHLLALLAHRRDGAVSHYVFADDLGRIPSNFRYSRETVAKLAGVEFSPYDLRRTFATIAESLDIPAYALKRLLNHADGGDVTAGYLVITTERLREPMQKITDYVLKAAGVKPSADIIQIPKQKEA